MGESGGCTTPDLQTKIGGRHRCPHSATQSSQTPISHTPLRRHRCRRHCRRSVLVFARTSFVLRPCMQSHPNVCTHLRRADVTILTYKCNVCACAPMCQSMAASCALPRSRPVTLILSLSIADPFTPSLSLLDFPPYVSMYFFSPSLPMLDCTFYGHRSGRHCPCDM